MKKGCLIFAGILVLIIIIFGSWFIRGYNTVAKFDEAVKASWRQVDTVLQRRYDLIPNLVNTVKGYAAHEEKVFTEVTRLRSQWGAAKSEGEKMGAAKGLEGAISRLLLVAENYPQLKSNENFLNLQAQLEGTENRISVQRMRYNDSVRIFNTYIRTFPGSIFAGMRGLSSPAVYFEAGEETRKVPEVKFE